ncbi:MAG: hypothetical protein KDB14_15965 [Planctomycetales bacterium]|nr:hypothetical protein [Planctomycetales bacterium]
MQIDQALTPERLEPAVERTFRLAADKSRDLERSWQKSAGAPVFTAAGRYTSRGWTEWTQGFQYGCQLLAGEGCRDEELIACGRDNIVAHMLPHATHTGVHDHGFNILSTYGNLLRLMSEGVLPDASPERHWYSDVIRVSGAVQASRWADTHCGLGYIYSFNGPHSLFIDTMRTVRVLSAAHRLGHVLMSEHDAAVNLLSRAVTHGLTTAKYIVFSGDSDHGYDIRGRTAHEGVFNRNDGRFRCRATQQGYSPFSTWTRGLAWAMLGFAEQLEFLTSLEPAEFERAELDRDAAISQFLRAATDTCEHYLEEVATLDGIAYWDDGAPQLHRLGDWRAQPAMPANPHEPVDASASAIAAQGLLRLGQLLDHVPELASATATGAAMRYRSAGLTVAQTLLQEPYLSLDPEHQGLLLHSVYHWPNRWDYVPPGQTVAYGESSLWGDYHLLELAWLIRRLATGGGAPTFFAHL